MQFVLLNKNGEKVNVGDRITDFRGEDWILTGTFPPHKEGASGKVNVRPVGSSPSMPVWKQSCFYAGVFDLKFHLER